MATQRIPILSFASRAENSANNAQLSKFDVSATNDQWDRLVYLFPDDGSNDTRLFGGFVVPKNFVGSPVIGWCWTTGVIAGSVSWEIGYLDVTGDDAESLDQNTIRQTDQQLIVVAGTAFNRLEDTASFTASNFAVDDEIHVYIRRRTNTDALDTAAGPAILFNMFFQYSDS